MRYPLRYMPNNAASDTSTFPLTDVPIGRGRMVTVPFIASSRTLADIVVLMGTPSLLQIK